MFVRLVKAERGLPQQQADLIAFPFNNIGELWSDSKNIGFGRISVNTIRDFGIWGVLLLA